MANVHCMYRRRFLASLMIASMILPIAAGCKKKSDEKSKSDLYTSGREILSSDPFFDTAVSEMKIPVDESKELESTGIGGLELLGDYVICTYTISYVVPDWLMKKQEHPEDMTPDEIRQLDECYVTKTGIFNMQGELVKDLGGKTDTPVFAATSDSDKNIYLLREEHDEFYTDIHIEAQVFDKDGNLKDRIVIEDPPVEIPGLSGSTSVDDAFQKELEESDYEIWDDPFEFYNPLGTAKMQILKDGSFLFSKKGTMSIYGRDGIKRCDVLDPDRDLEANAFLIGDKYYVLSVLEDEKKGRSVQVKELNITNGALSQGKESVALADYENPMVTESGVFFATLNGCLQYDFDTDTVNEVFSWNDTDVNRSLLSYVKCLPETGDRLNAIAFKKQSRDPSLIQMTRAEKNPHAGKKIIRIGGMHLDGDENLLTFLSQYNADPSGKTRTVLIDYTADRDTDVDSAETVKKLYLDILSGTGPDIVVNMGDSEMFRNSRVMEDLNPYLDGPDGIDRTKFFDNVFHACERDGKLYSIPIDFLLEGMMVNTDLISNTKGWTYDEFSASVKALPEDVSIFHLYSYNELMRLMLGTSMSEFVNYQNQTVDFQNDEMKKILDLVRDYGVQKVLPGERKGVDIKNYEDGSVTYMIVTYADEKLKESMIAAKDVTIYSVNDIAYEGRLLPGKAGFLGFPSSDGTGMAVHPNRTLGILSSSKYKDLAWDVIRAYLEYDNENIGDLGIPVNRESFEKQCLQIRDEIKRRFQEEYEEFYELLGIYTEIKDEDIATLRELVENADSSVAMDEAVFSIISEEAAGYFAGDRTKEDVLNIIQNRAKIVVTEV